MSGRLITPWVKYAMQYQREHGTTYKQALISASPGYRSLSLPKHWLEEYPLDVSVQMEEEERKIREEEDRQRRIKEHDEYRAQKALERAGKARKRKRPGVLKERQLPTQDLLQDPDLMKKAAQRYAVKSTSAATKNTNLKERAKEFSEKLQQRAVEPVNIRNERKVVRRK